MRGVVTARGIELRVQGLGFRGLRVLGCREWV